MWCPLQANEGSGACSAHTYMEAKHPYTENKNKYLKSPSFLLMMHTIVSLCSFLYVFIFVCVIVYILAKVCVWNSEDNCRHQSVPSALFETISVAHRCRNQISWCVSVTGFFFCLRLPSCCRMLLLPAPCEFLRREHMAALFQNKGFM